MADDSCLSDAKLFQRRLEDHRLPIGWPRAATRPLAISEAGPIESVDLMPFREPLDQSARDVVLDHCHVAVDKDDRFTGPPHEIMQAQAGNGQELTYGRIAAFTYFSRRKYDYGQRQCNESADRYEFYLAHK